MSYKFIRRSPQLTRELIPLKAPLLVRKDCAILALVCIIAFPFEIMPALYLEKVLQKWAPFFKPDIRLGISMLVVFMVPWGIASWIIFSQISKFILKNVNYHIENHNIDKAERLSLMLDYQVWYREFKKNEWFRKFIIENNLIEKSERYRRFYQRFNRRQR